LTQTLKAGGVVLATPAMLEAMTGRAEARRQLRRAPTTLREPLDASYLSDAVWGELPWKGDAIKAFSPRSEIEAYLSATYNWKRKLIDSFLEMGNEFLGAAGSMLRFFLPPVLFSGLNMTVSVLSTSASILPGLAQVGGRLMLDGAEDLAQIVKDCVFPFVVGALDRTFHVVGNVFRAVSMLLNKLEGGQPNLAIRKSLMPAEGFHHDGWELPGSTVVEGGFHPAQSFSDDGSGVFLSRHAYTPEGTPDVPRYILGHYSPAGRATYLLEA